jgi:hypothetical protein
MPLKCDSSSLLLAELSLAQIFCFALICAWRNIFWVWLVVCLLFHFTICQNCIRENVGSILNSEYACWYSFQNLCLTTGYSKTNIKVHRTIILLFCGCDTWSRTVREKYRFSVIENRMLLRIFRPRRQVTDGQTIVQNGELRNFHFPVYSHHTQDTFLPNTRNTSGKKNAITYMPTRQQTHYLNTR